MGHARFSVRINQIKSNLVADCQTLETRADIEANNCGRASNDTRHSALLRLLETYQAAIARTDERVAKLWLRADASDRHRVLCWASSIPYEKVHETALAGRTPGTGQWLLGHARFREWRDCSASMIPWLSGIRKMTGLPPLLPFLSPHFILLFALAQRRVRSIMG